MFMWLSHHNTVHVNMYAVRVLHYLYCLCFPRDVLFLSSWVEKCVFLREVPYVVTITKESNNSKY